MSNPFNQEAKRRNGGSLPKRFRDMLLLDSSEHLSNDTISDIKQRTNPLTIAVIGNNDEDAQKTAQSIRELLKKSQIKGIRVGFTSEETIQKMTIERKNHAYKLLGGAHCQDGTVLEAKAQSIAIDREPAQRDRSKQLEQDMEQRVRE